MPEIVANNARQFVLATRSFQNGCIHRWPNADVFESWPIDRLLGCIDDVCDAPPSETWLAMLSIVLLHISEQRTDWPDLAFRFSNLAQRVPTVVNQCEMGNITDEALEEMIENLICAFPIGPFNFDANEIESSMPLTKSRDDVFASSVELSSLVVQECRSLRAIEAWIQTASDAPHRANFVASMLCFILSNAPRSDLYSREEFVAASVNRELMKQHLDKVRDVLISNYGHAGMEIITQFVALLRRPMDAVK